MFINCQCFEKDGSRISIDNRIDVSQKFTTLLHFEFLCQKKVKHTKPNHVESDLCPSSQSIFEQYNNTFPPSHSLT